MKQIAKRLAQLLLGDYSAYLIFSLASVGDPPCQSKTPNAFSVGPVDASAISASDAPLIREQVGYAGAGSHAYACFHEDRIVGVCFYWFGERYLQRNFWPLADCEAKLVQIISIPELRSRGIAARLIELSAQDMSRKGFGQMYARVWHSNTPSRRAFKKAGWRTIALVLEVNPLRKTRPIRICFNFKLPAESD